ncbi:MAG: ABC transporter substrate-binding protein [Gammaproteobacteria bacterium]|nr:ABC transporter substrate-binding protein [Gammaproteobacteria bacterium]
MPGNRVSNSFSLASFRGAELLQVATLLVANALYKHKSIWRGDFIMRFIRYFAIASLVVGALVVHSTPVRAEAACEPDKLATKYPSLADKKIKVGVDAGIPPYTYREEGNFENIIGFDADLARAVFECHGIDFEFFAGAWSGLLPAVIAGQVDAMWSDLYYTSERAKEVDYATYMKAGTGALVRKGNPDGITSLESACGHTIAVGLGTVEEAAMREETEKCKAAGKDEVNILTYPDVAAGVRLVGNERASAMLTDLALVDRLVKDSPDSFERGFYLLTDFTIGVAVKNGNDELLNAVYDGLQVMQGNGTQDEIFKKYTIDPVLSHPTSIQRD